MKNIRIEGRRWFNRTFGNTYFSANAYVDGEHKVQISYEYGYGDQYLYEAFRGLEEQGIITDREHYSNGSREAPWRWAERHNVKLHTNVVDVSRKKDL